MAGGCSCRCFECDIGNHCGRTKKGCYFYKEDDDEEEEEDD